MKRQGCLLILSVAVFVFVTGAPSVIAQTYPSRNIQLIIPNVPGSIMDVNSRAVVDELGRILGTEVIPINKPGAGAVVGTQQLAKSKNDGYTIGYTSNAPLVYARILNPETVEFNLDKDLEPLGLHTLFPNAISVLESTPWKTFKDLLDYSKQNPGKVRVGTMGIGSPSHFSLEVINSVTGAGFTHVPFKGGEALVGALLGGHIEMTFDAVMKYVPHVEAGKVRILLLTSKLPTSPQLPTLKDFGFNQDLFSSWFAFYAPSGLPDNVKKVLLPAIEKAVKHPEMKSKLEKLQYVVEYKSPAEVKKMVSDEYERAMAVATKAGLIKK